MGDYTKYLEYVRNTNGGATPENFAEDFEPIGVAVWHYIHNNGLVKLGTDGRIYLTDEGAAMLPSNAGGKP